MATHIPDADREVAPPYFELRIGFLFAAIFTPLGIHLPYLPLWLDSVGLPPEQIAVVLSAPMFLRLLTTSYITSYADRAPDRVYVLSACCALALLASSGYFLPPTYVGILAVSLALTIVWSPHSPLADSIALSGVRRFGASYSRMRIWGSISFVCANFVGGLVLADLGAAAVPAMISVGLIAALVCSALAPRLGPPRRASSLSTAALSTLDTSLFNRKFLLLVASAGVIHATHTFQFSFGSIYWKSIGVGDAVIGSLWAFAVVAEVAMFFVFTRIFRRSRNRTILIVAGIGAFIRWLLFPLIWPSGLGIAGFFASQALHSVSTALVILGVQKIIAESIAEEKTGAAQGVAFFVNGLSFGVLTLLSGPLYERLGVDGFYVMAGFAVFGVALAMLSSPPQFPRRR